MKPFSQNCRCFFASLFLIMAATNGETVIAGTIEFDGERICSYESPKKEFGECAYWCNSNKVRYCYKENKDQCDSGSVGERYQCMESICGLAAADCQCECAKEHAENFDDS